MAALKHQDINNEHWHVSTWAHRASLASGCTMVLISLAKSIILTTVAQPGSRTWLPLAVAALAAYILVDLVSGMYHWAIDNYGSALTPVFGSQIESFQSHHRQPWEIAKREVANNLYIPAAVATATVFPMNILSDDPVLLAFVGVFIGLGMVCQQFHAWAHTPKGRLPAVVAALQDVGIIIGRDQHAAHHQPPYDGNYCIVSGVWNRFLDWSKFFVAAEVVVFRVVGIRPRSWSLGAVPIQDELDFAD